MTSLTSAGTAAISSNGVGIRAEEPVSPYLYDLYRAATPEAKLAAVARLNATLIGLKEAHFAATQPDWTPERRRVELRRWWLGTRD